MSVTVPVSNGRFFSVKYNTTIGTGQFRPAVCYRLTRDIQTEVENMAAAEGRLARIYEEEVRFISGVPYPIKKPSLPVPTAPAPVSSSASQATSPAILKPKRGRKEFM